MNIIPSISYIVNKNEQENGAAGGTRTRDLRFRKPMLTIQLSYHRKKYSKPKSSVRY